MIRSILQWILLKLQRYLDSDFDKKIEEKDRELKELREMLTNSNILIAAWKNDYTSQRVSLQEKDKKIQRLGEERKVKMEALDELQKRLDAKTNFELVSDTEFPSSR